MIVAFPENAMALGMNFSEMWDPLVFSCVNSKPPKTESKLCSDVD